RSQPMTSKLTRERLQEIAEDGFLKHGESKELARMALAAMDSEPVILYRERNPYNGLTTGWHELTENEFLFLKENAGENAEFLTLYRHAQPALVIPDEMTAEQAYEIGYYYGDPVNVFARGANWMRQHIIDSTLAAAPQSPGSDPATVPGKWIPVSERIPDNTEPVLCIEKRADFGTYGQPFVCWHDGGGWVGKTNYRPIVTHWMPLPAAPQEVKSE
ncbi:DUF551 domain-containing protein, partial [Klebsiella pneumoniae]|nr:DUF551 domain-containing protein [Klebsiella pneumoniae]